MNSLWSASAPVGSGVGVGHGGDHLGPQLGDESLRDGLSRRLGVGVARRSSRPQERRHPVAVARSLRTQKDRELATRRRCLLSSRRQRALLCPHSAPPRVAAGWPRGQAGQLPRWAALRIAYPPDHRRSTDLVMGPGSGVGPSWRFPSMTEPISARPPIPSTNQSKSSRLTSFPLPASSLSLMAVAVSAESAGSASSSSRLE